MRKIDLNNEYLPVEDRKLYEKMNGHFVSEKERMFFDEMICKELYDCPMSVFDVIMSESDNEERIFIQKEYNSEYVIGRFLDEDKYTVIDNRPLCLSELISTDLFTLLNTHITVLEWLRKRDFAGVRYDYPWED
jgi:hypothetical protein